MNHKHIEYGLFAFLFFPFFRHSVMPTDIKTKLTYLHWQPTYTQTRPYRIAQFGRKKKNDEQAHNLVFRKGDFAETIHDIRGVNEDTKYTLETNGFVYARHPPPIFTQPKDFLDPDQVRNVFLPECEAILRKEIEGVERIFIFDWKVGNVITYSK
jgi:hypothetical protein